MFQLKFRADPSGETTLDEDTHEPQPQTEELSPTSFEGHWDYRDLIKWFMGGGVALPPPPTVHNLFFGIPCVDMEVVSAFQWGGQQPRPHPPKLAHCCTHTPTVFMYGWDIIIIIIKQCWIHTSFVCKLQYLHLTCAHYCWLGGKNQTGSWTLCVGIQPFSTFLTRTASKHAEMWDLMFELLVCARLASRMVQLHKASSSRLSALVKHDEFPLGVSMKGPLIIRCV